MSKYRNKKVVLDGIKFDSILEARRWDFLKLLERAGKITDLERQVRFEVVPKCEQFRAKYYIADFVYRDENGNQIVEDTKGLITDVFRLKQHLMSWRYGIEVKLIRKGDF